MEANNLKISADLQSYIKSIVHTELSIHESATAIPTYAMYSYSSMSTSSVTPGTITIDGQDIVDYCEEMKMDLDTDTNIIQTHEADIADLKAKINSQVTEDEFNEYKVEVSEALEKKVDNSTLNEYAKKTDLNDYVTVETLTFYAKRSELDNYVKTSALNDYAKKSDLNDYAKTSLLESYAKKSELNEYAKKIDLNDYAKTSLLESYAKISTLNEYAKKSDLNDYVKTSALSAYAKKSDLDNYISSSTFETYKSTMAKTIKSLEDRIAALEG